MFLRKTERRKNGKAHLYWSVVENRRLDDGRVVQRHVLYLGEINSSQAEAWRRAVEVFDEDEGRPRSLSLFPEDRCETPAGDDVIRLRLSEMRLCRPRQFGACWLAGVLWRELRLDRFWAERLPANRKGTRWDRRAASAGDLSAHFAGQRVAAASPMVPRQRHGRSARRRLRPRRSS